MERDHKKDAQEALNKIKKPMEFENFLKPNTQELHAAALIEAVQEATKEYNVNLISSLTDTEIQKELIKRGFMVVENHEAITYTKMKKGFE